MIVYENWFFSDYFVWWVNIVVEFGNFGVIVDLIFEMIVKCFICFGVLVVYEVDMIFVNVVSFYCFDLC